MTNIKTQWRLEKLTEIYGPVGKGWKVENVEYTIIDMPPEKLCICSLNLYVLYEDNWSQPIYETGGSKILAQEKSGIYIDDEAYKKAYSDAISTACRPLGIGADVYMDANDDKYSEKNTPNKAPQKAAPAKTLDPKYLTRLIDYEATGKDLKAACKWAGAKLPEFIPEEKAKAILFKWDNEQEAS